MQTATAYLETLNPEQRRAVEHGAGGGLAAPPLLVIAGAWALGGVITAATAARPKV